MKVLLVASFGRSLPPLVTITFDDRLSWRLSYAPSNKIGHIRIGHFGHIGPKIRHENDVDNSNVTFPKPTRVIVYSSIPRTNHEIVIVDSLLETKSTDQETNASSDVHYTSAAHDHTTILKVVYLMTAICK